MKLVTCHQCGTQNRVKAHSLRQAVYCGNCHYQLSEPLIIRFAQLLDRYKYWLILAGIIGGALIMDEYKSTARSSNSASNFTQQGSLPPRPKVVDYPVVPINPGIQAINTKAERIAPLRIKTPAGTESYFVKLVSASTGKEVMTFYIRSGQTLDTEVPLGSYRIKYATGDLWYGETHLFGPESKYSEAEKVFQFARNGDEISGYTVELIRQRGGNLQTRAIPPSQF
jgi:hypothetical protein